VGEVILERRLGGHWAKEWDLSLIPNYKTRFDPATVNLLECRAKELRFSDGRGRPLIVWPDDPECPLEEVHEFLFSNLFLWAGNALLDQNWHIRTHYPPSLRTDPDYIRIGFKSVVSTPRASRK
jgi:hypothetical protein